MTKLSQPLQSDLSQPLQSELANEYEAVLRDYLRGGGEAALERAYELGRQALADRLGVLDVTRLHHYALLNLSASTPEWRAWARTITIAEEVLIEALTPFEMTHRGFEGTHADLQASEERYRELFENANDIVFTTDLEGKFTSINRAGERLTGYTRREVLSKNCELVIAPEFVRAVREAREAKLSGADESTQYELEIFTKDGRRVPLEVSTRLIRRGGVAVAVQGIARDIAERKLAEQALRRMNERLEEGIKRISYALHDEAGQLLTGVYLAVEDIARELPPEHRDRLKQVFGPLDHAASQLRCLSHELHPVILDDLGLVAALETLADGVSRRSGLSVDVEASIEARLPAFIETGLYRIIQEALTNATKHARATHVRVELRREGGILSCVIRDDGIGLDASALNAVKRKSCLGLVGIRERLVALSGSLAITTGAGQGTTLQIRIPLES
jgi:two-component system sensor histidine kinase NreB